MRTPVDRFPIGKQSRTGCLWAIGLFALAGGALALLVYRSVPKYPYGRSHCCSKVLGMALHEYADSHGGRYPTGEASPEASLSLLYREGLCNANTLRGKIIPLDEVETVLNRGDLLGPDTCGWHYVEGLTRKDDSRIAIIWDKVGLGHNGESLRDGGHWVMFIHGSEEHVPENKWQEFLGDQKRLIAARTP